MKIFVVIKTTKDDDGITHDQILSAFVDETEAKEFAKVNVKFTNEDTWVYLISEPGVFPEIIATFP